MKTLANRELAIEHYQDHSCYEQTKLNAFVVKFVLLIALITDIIVITIRNHKLFLDLAESAKDERQAAIAGKAS